MEASKFQNLRAQCDAKVAAMEQLDYAVLKKEVRSFCSISSSGNGLQDLASQMQAVQAAKDRLSDILPAIHDNSIVRRSIANTLTEAYLGVSEASNTDKRKGMAALELGSYELEAAVAEGFYKYCWGYMKNLDSKHEAVSRRISCLQLGLKLYDFGGGTVPGLAEPKNTADRFSPDSQPETPSAPKQSWGKTGETDW